MLGTIRKHQTWLWWVIGGITVASFIYWGTKTGNQGGGRGDNRPEFVVEFQGRKFSMEEYVQMQSEVYLDYWLNSGQRIPRDTPAIRQEVLQRLLLLKKQEDLGIDISTEAAVEFAKQHLLQPLAARFGIATFGDFIDKHLKPEGLNEADFERYLRHKLANDQLISVAGANGRLVTPGEAETIYRSEHEPRAASVVFFAVSNYMSSVTETPEALQAYYSNAIANYKIPERIRVAYVKFNVTNLFADSAKAITNLDRLVDENAVRPGMSNLFPEAKTSEDLKKLIRDRIVRDRALEDTHRVAASFALELDKTKTNRTVAGFEALAASKGLKVEVSEPFDESEAPTNLDVRPDFTSVAFSLSPDSPFSRSIMAEDGYYVLALKDKLPVETPSFKSVEDKVKKDYRLQQARELTRAEVEKFNLAVTNGVAAGKNFSNICAEAKVTPEHLSPFSLSSTNVPPEVKDRISLSVYRNVIFETRVGSVSRPFGTQDGAFVLSVDKTLPVDEEQLKKDLPAFLTQIRRGRMYDAFNQWLNAEIRMDAGFAMQLQAATDQAEGRTPAKR